MNSIQHTYYIFLDLTIQLNLLYTAVGNQMRLVFCGEFTLITNKRPLNNLNKNQISDLVQMQIECNVNVKYLFLMSSRMLLQSSL
jgi:hypothetical protein